MGHSYSNVLVHVVFSTKNRAIIPGDRREELWRYMTGIAKRHKVNVISIGGMPDHIHMLMALPERLDTLGDSDGKRELVKVDGTRFRMAGRIRSI